MPAERVSTDLVLPDGTTHHGRLTFNDDGSPCVDMATCGECGFEWNDALITGITPTPVGRCPNEYSHEDDSDDGEQHEGHFSRLGGTWWCDTCNNPYCDLA